MATAVRQDKLHIQIKSIKTVMSTIFTQKSSFSEVLKRKYLTLQQYEDQLIDILTEGNETEQLYEESTNFAIVYQETLHRFFYKNSFNKNHQAQNCQKIKNILRIMARLKYMIKNLESPILILHQESALFTMECLLFTMEGLQFRKTCV